MNGNGCLKPLELVALGTSIFSVTFYAFLKAFETVERRRVLENVTRDEVRAAINPMLRGRR